MYKSNVKIKVGSEKSFGLTFGIIFLVLALLSFQSFVFSICLFSLSLIIFLITFNRVHWLKTPNFLWFRFGILVGAIIAPIIMFLIYLIIITPYGKLLSLFRQDPLSRKYDKKTKSYWIKRKDELRNFNNQF